MIPESQNNVPNNVPNTAADLRRRAEAALPPRAAPAGTALSLADAQRLLHELQVQRVELEMQNEELQQSRNAFATAAARYADLYDAAPVGYLTLDRDAAIVDANRAAALLLGSDRDRLLGKRLPAFVAELDRRALNDCLGAAHVAPALQACELLLADGTPPRALRVEATRDNDGNHCRVVLHDVTARRRQDTAMRLLETSIAHLHDVVMITDASLATPGPRIEFVNAACERITGYSREELVGRNPRMLQGPRTDRAELRRIQAALHKGEAVRAELINHAKDGSAYWIELSITPVHAASGVVTNFVAVQRDISERREAQAQAATQLQALQERNHELDRFNRAMIDREVRMLELKAQVNALHSRLGEPPRYALQDAATPAADRP